VRVREISGAFVAIGIASLVVVLDVGLRVIESRLFSRFDELMAREPQADSVTRLRFVQEDRATLRNVRRWLTFAVSMVALTIAWAPARSFTSAVMTPALVAIQLVNMRSTAAERRRLRLPPFGRADWIIDRANHSAMPIAIFVSCAMRDFALKQWLAEGLDVVLLVLAAAAVVWLPGLRRSVSDPKVDEAISMIPDWDRRTFVPVIVADSTRRFVEQLPNALVVSRALLDASSVAELRDVLDWRRGTRLRPMLVVFAIGVVAFLVFAAADLSRRAPPIGILLFGILATRRGTPTPPATVSENLAILGERVIESELDDFPHRATVVAGDLSDERRGVITVPPRSTSDSLCVTAAGIASGLGIIATFLVVLGSR